MVATTWSGTFANEGFVGPGTYQAKNGVRAFIDMKTSPGPVTVDAIVSPDNDSSFIIEWDNPNREVLTFASAADDFEDPVSVVREVPSFISVIFRRGTVAFTFVDDKWQIFDWSLYGVALTTVFCVAWRGQNTNGLCALVGKINGVEVERTAKGFYTVRIKPGIITAGETLVMPAPIATGLTPDTSAVVLIDDVGMATVDEILVNTGTRNKGGVFLDDDLIQNVNNISAIVGQQFP